MQANTGEIPLLFRLTSAVVPCIGLVKVARLGQRLNVPTQGRRAAPSQHFKNQCESIRSGRDTEGRQ